MSYPTERPAGKEHIPLYTKGFVAVRIIQLILGTICLGLSAYLTAVVPIIGGILMLFTSIVGFITSIYCLVAHFGPPNAYNYWAILGLDIFHVIFWLVSFGLLAAQAALLLAYTYYDYYYDYYYTAYAAYGAIAAAAAALGAFNWVVYLAALICHSIALHRHRKAGLHAMPGRTTGAAPVVASELPMQPQQPQAYYPKQAEAVSYQQQPPQQFQQQVPQPYQQPPQ
ncbi:hypothetical protein F5B22DRAFT_541425 [Xylaria bambusicola]|uniref:uncharacterized protein n=1 Tax=Xylaria bambusicola TaxID=326684 RepID=UPI002008D0D4|nr:uncharacterized protein F5B22DRAFT_541425 [Xylaria bambusicola]KAI0521531.1 hypothetical protein F5B22DRAFT_541425 [Xylaria bambusicola]